MRASKTTVHRMAFAFRSLGRAAALTLLVAAAGATTASIEGAARAGEAPPPAEAGEPAALTRPPKLLKFVKAESPPALADKGAVDVILEIDIDDKGKVAKVAVAQSGGAEFDEAARKAAEQFEFQPGYAGDKPVPVRITYRYRFKMQPPAPPPAPTPPPASTPSTTAEVPPAPLAPPPVDTVPFKGQVLKKGDRTAISGASIFLEIAPAPAEPLTAITDADGRFVFDNVPVGERKVKVAGAGLQASETTESFKKGKRLEATYYVFEKERYASVVRGRRLVKETVEQTLDVEEIKRIPGTQGDTLKAVQNLPGVARAPFGGGQLIVWGSNPRDTRVYVDDVYIPTLYHFAGLRAVLPSESVQSLTFTPGGFGAEHGWGLGGVVQVDTSKPKNNGYHGFVQLDIIDGSFRVEGPITKNLDFAISARRSWIDVFLPLFTSNSFQLSPKYWDYQAKLHWKASARDDFDLLIFGSDDSVEVQTKNPNPNLSAQFGSHIYFHRGLARWLHRFDDGAQLSLTGALGYDIPFQFAANFGNTGLNVDVKSCPYSLRATYRKPLAEFLRIDAGLDFEGTRYGNNATAPISGPPREDSTPGGFGGPLLSTNENAYTHLIAPWASLAFSFFDKRLFITPAFRLAVIEDNGSYASTLGGSPVPAALLANASGSFQNTFVRLEPRLSVRYQFLKQAAFKAAIGFYSQAPDAQSLFGPFGNVNSLPETSVHYVAGFDIKPYSTLSISVEGFYKDLRNLIVGNERTGASQPVLVNDGIGRVYGGELLVRQEFFKGFFGWLSYTVSRSERKDHPDSGDWRLFQFDQTHILTAIASYKFGRGYQVGARFRYVTGSPYTPIVGGYVGLNGGGYTAVNGPLYSGRLDSFNQLDVRFDKTWTYNRFTFALYLDIQNVYNAKNPEGYQYNYNFTQRQPVAGIPFFPALGVRGDF